MRASVVLPEPDSPTSATTSPARTTRSAPSRARATRPLRVVNSTRTPSADSSAAGVVVHGGHSADPDAGGLAALVVRREDRLGREALVGGPRAARREGAALGEVARVGRVARETGRGEPRRGVADARERRRQGAGVRVQGRGEDLRGRAGLDHASGVHHRDPVAQVGEHREVVADHHHPDPAFADQVGEHVEHLGLHHHVERGGRLVGDHQVGVAGERHRDHHPLLLTARQLVGVAAGAVGVEPDLLEQLGDARGAPSPR